MSMHSKIERLVMQQDEEIELLLQRLIAVGGELHALLTLRNPIFDTWQSRHGPKPRRYTHNLLSLRVFGGGMLKRVEFVGAVGLIGREGFFCPKPDSISARNAIEVLTYGRGDKNKTQLIALLQQFGGADALMDRMLDAAAREAGLAELDESYLFPDTGIRDRF